LRKKKFQTEQLERTEASLDTIEKLIQDLEYTQIEAKVFTQNIILLFKQFI
jgi:peptidyl-tRNA hydrolase